MIAPLLVAVACGHPVVRVAPAPPEAVVARTACGTYELRPDGRVAKHRAGAAPAWAPHAVSHPGPGVWVAHPKGRLAIYRTGRLLWRSRIKVASDEVVVHGSSIAFGRYESYDAKGPTLWMARVGGREFRVAAREEPIGWTAGGLATQQGNRIRVRAPDGTIARTLALGRSAVYDRDDETVVFVSRDGALVRTDGRHVWPLARGLPRSAWVTVLGNRMLQVTLGNRALYLRSNGSRFGVGDTPTGGVIGLPGQRGVVYVMNRRRAKGGASVTGVNVVEALDATGRVRRLYAHRVPHASCGEWAYVSYANGWILYVDSEGPAAVLDPTGRRRPLDLAPALRPLQPRRTPLAQLYADWRSNWR